MKNLIFINGTMGVGKTATSNELKKLLSNSVFLDGDWCWDMDPFIVNEETKRMVIDNITHLLNNFLHCSELKNIIFCWVMHEQSIISEIISRLDVSSCHFYAFSLICSEKALRHRITKDARNARSIAHCSILSTFFTLLPLFTYNIVTNKKGDFRYVL